MRTPIIEGGREKQERYLKANPTAAAIAEQYHIWDSADANTKSIDAVAENPHLTRDAIVAAVQDAEPELWYLPGIQSLFARHLVAAGSGLSDLIAKYGPSHPPLPTQEALRSFGR